MGLFSKRAAVPGNPIDSPRARVHTATDGRDMLVNSPDGWEVDAPWMWFLGPAGSDGTGGPFGNPPPGAEATSFYSSLPAVRRCTSIIVNGIVGLPWQVVRDETERLPTPDWIADPQALRIDGRVIGAETLTSIRLSDVEFWANWIVAALWLGDAYVYVPVRDANGAPKPPLWQLHPSKVTIDQGAYWVGDIPLPAGSVIHLRGEGPYYDGHGHGVITEHCAALGLASVVSSYAAGVFQSGVPAGYLKSTAPSLTQEKADELKARWMSQHGGYARSIAVLNATTEFTPIAISPVDAQLSSAREWSLRDIALAFNVPPYMLGVPGDSATYANVENRMIDLRTFTHKPWQDRIEATLSAEFPRGTNVRINSDGFLRADTKTRYEAYKVGVDGGWLTIDEVRAKENLPPLESEAVL